MTFLKFKILTYKIFREMAMRLATSPHHTNPRSATLDFWRQTTSVEEYKKVQERRRLQTNRPTSSNEQKEEHLIIGKRPDPCMKSEVLIQIIISYF